MHARLPISVVEQVEERHTFLGPVLSNSQAADLTLTPKPNIPQTEPYT